MCGVKIMKSTGKNKFIGAILQFFSTIVVKFIFQSETSLYT